MRKCPKKEEDEKASKGEDTISIKNDNCLTSTTPLLISSLAPTNTVVTSAVAPIITNPTINSSNVTTNPHIESSMIGTTLVQMQPSTSIHLGNWLTRDLGEGRHVADMADVLFNSGSSNSSMDAIFSSQHEN
ncbi:WRKY transcription factor 55-like protein [Carex littledalei]|uniref:WRKY transcription factor 55-like protein n=1 Tax=Carex littledalei TaxID=544730 RepID=A0A833Q745_9POAL|nr:WRKY transcription factor 55-like protein [Carex littledalei]